MLLIFFFQAEDGIRDADVTGVQTCALPISSGSWRRIARRPVAKLIPAAALTWVWLTFSNVYSIGSSIVVTFSATRSISLMEAYSVVVLPLPVGPATTTMPN